MKECIRRGGVNLARGLGSALFAMTLMLAMDAQLSANSRRDNQPLQPVTVQVQADCTANGSATVARHSQTGAVRFIGAGTGRVLRPSDSFGAATAEQAARSYLTACGALFGITDAERNLTITREHTAPDRRSMVRYQQTHNGVPVLAGELVVNLDASRNVTSVTGETLPAIHIDTEPRINAATARSTVLAELAKHYGVNLVDLLASEPQLWIYSPGLLRPEPGPTELVWRMQIRHQSKLEIRALVLVNAHRGGVSLHFNQTAGAKNRKTYTANNGTLTPGTLRCDETNPTCVGGDAHEIAAHTYAGDAYDFYLTNHGRDSIDNAGMTLISTVHYGIGISDAMWNGAQLIYGDGAGWPLADDMVAHEWTHGVTERESGLFHYYQSGSIGESLSDLFGELVDLSNGAGDDSDAVRWKIGEDIVGLGAVRDMKDPTMFGDPDRMTSPNYSFANCGNWTSNCDSGGVHRNSGVNNKAAFLLVDGGTFNGKSVSPLGMFKVAKIYYEAQTNLLTAGSDYADLYTALYQACQNLIGGGITNAPDCFQVREATDAVEMNAQPAAGYNPDAPVCPTGSPSTIFFDDMESGASNWTFGGIVGDTHWSRDGDGVLDFPHSGSHFLYGDDYSTTGSDSFVAMNTSVALPPNAYLHFFHAYGFEDPNIDGGILEYSTDEGGTWKNASSLLEVNGYDGWLSPANPLGGIQAWVSDSHGYISSRLRLATLAGGSVRFRWRLGTNSSVFDRGWFLDDVRIYTCGIVGPVTVTQVRVTNKADQDLTEVHRGEKVFYRITLQNAGALACYLSVHLVVKKMGNALTDVTLYYTIAPGESTVKIKRKIPDDAAFLTYKVKATSECNGQKDAAKDKFSVIE